MNLTELRDDVLVRRVHTLVARDRAITASLLAHLAEVDVRRLYAAAGYPSLHAWCVGELRLSDDAAYKRITAARAARRFPVLLERLADGSLHLSAVKLLAAHLTPENCGELIALAVRLSKTELERELGRRALPMWSYDPPVPSSPMETAAPLAPGPVAELAPPAAPAPEPALEPRFVLHVVIAPSTRSKLAHVQALLAHAVPSGDTAQLLDRALDALIEKVEGRKFGRVPRPRALSVGAPARPRLVPAHVRRAVWERDGGQCTFVSPGGHLCGSRAFLEYDHVDPVARGGTATVERMRLRCRTHNQLEAERTFGRAYMDAKREEARGVDRDVVAALRRLGMGAREAERVTREADIPPDAPLEERLRTALRSIRTRGTHREEPAGAPRGT